LLDWAAVLVPSRPAAVHLAATLAAAVLGCLGCEDTDCTDGTVKVVAALPVEVTMTPGATLLVQVESAGAVLAQATVPAGAEGTATVELTFPPPGYPKGRTVTVVAVAKGGAGSVLGTQFAQVELSSGCQVVSFTLVAGTDDGGLDGQDAGADGGPVVDAAVVDAAVDAAAPDIAGDAGTGDAEPGDAQAPDAGVPDAPTDAT
jgi:hypothetical protein